MIRKAFSNPSVTSARQWSSYKSASGQFHRREERHTSAASTYLYCRIVDVERWIIISMTMLRNDIAIVEHDGRPWLLNAPVVMEHDNITEI